MFNDFEIQNFWKKPETVLDKAQRLVSQGFLCEVVTDAWALWKFKKDGTPDYDTAVPAYQQKDVIGRTRTPMFRGICWYFTKEGKLIQDDTGLYSTIEEAYNKLFEMYHLAIDNIHTEGFVISKKD